MGLTPIPPGRPGGPRQLQTRSGSHAAAGATDSPEAVSAEAQHNAGISAVLVPELGYIIIPEGRSMKPRIFIAAGLTLLLAGPPSAEDRGHAAQRFFDAGATLCRNIVNSETVNEQLIQCLAVEEAGCHLVNQVPSLNTDISLRKDCSTIRIVASQLSSTAQSEVEIRKLSLLGSTLR
jgi:hypothetical protein